MYNNLMNKFSYGNVRGEGVYVNHDILRMCMNLRNNFARCAEKLIQEGKNDKAKEVLDRCLYEMPSENIPYNYFILPIAENYYRLEDKEKANGIISEMHKDYVEELDYYFSLKKGFYENVNSQAQQSISILYRLNLLAQQYDSGSELATALKEDFDRLEKTFSAKQ